MINTLGYKQNAETKEETKKIYNAIRKFKTGKVIIIEASKGINFIKNRMFEVENNYGWRGVTDATNDYFIEYLTWMYRQGVQFRLATKRESLLFYTHGRDALIDT